MPFCAKRSLVAISVLIAAATAQGAPRRRALLVGIDDYSGGKTTRSARDLKNLDGAGRDVELARQLLLSVYRLEASEIVTLRDRAATRSAILDTIDSHLLRGARKGDVLLFYFSGHGSQVPNSLSEEDDRLDESIVPADARNGAPDIRDKELRRRFLPVVELGARLTIVLDSCHSASGVREPAGGKLRFASPDTHDVKDPDRGPKLEDRGALILAAAGDKDLAFEIRDDAGKFRGVFSWAWARAIRDAARGEPASETFQRAAARMSVERPDQIPVIAGTAEARSAPFVGPRQDRRSDQVVVAVRSVEKNGIVTIQGGWANGLTLGSELQPVTVPPSDTRLEVIALTGVQRCTARIKTGSANALHSGSLLALAAWAPPRERPLRIWIPIGDTRGASALAQIPASTALAAQITALDGVERVTTPAGADYLLAGRLRGDRIEYAWTRPVNGRDREQSTLPLRSDWHDGTNTTRAATLLSTDLRRLQRIHFWLTIPSPPQTPFAYRLGVRRARDGALMNGQTLEADEGYGFVLLAAPGARVSRPRFVYVFMVDSAGRSVLFYPRSPIGSVENRFPASEALPAEIRLGPSVAMIPEAPFGIDTYFLLSTEEPLTTPWILEWDGVQKRVGRGGTAFERLLLRTMSGDRAALLASPSRWSLERVPFRSVAAPRARDANSEAPQ